VVLELRTDEGGSGAGSRLRLVIRPWQRLRTDGKERGERGRGGGWQLRRAFGARSCEEVEERGSAREQADPAGGVPDRVGTAATSMCVDPSGRVLDRGG
jgi:hypothetical protein